MQIKGMDQMTGQQLRDELERGGKFVIYEYTISIVLMTFKRGSDIYFIRGDESAVVKGLGYSLLTFFLGWWGFPWGPIYTIGAFITNFGGGKNVTQEVLASLR